MLMMKFLALIFAVLVLTKIIMLLVARDYWLGLVDKSRGCSSWCSRGLSPLRQRSRRTSTCS